MSMKLKKQVKDLAADNTTTKAAIGTETTEGTILYRIKALETAASSNSGGGSS